MRLDEKVEPIGPMLGQCVTLYPSAPEEANRYLDIMAFPAMTPDEVKIGLFHLLGQKCVGVNSLVVIDG